VVSHEQGQEVEDKGLQRDRTAGAEDLPALLVEFELAKLVFHASLMLPMSSRMTNGT
jgi:hypothetical protein